MTVYFLTNCTSSRLPVTFKMFRQQHCDRGHRPCLRTPDGMLCLIGTPVGVSAQDRSMGEQPWEFSLHKGDEARQMVNSKNPQLGISYLGQGTCCNCWWSSIRVFACVRVFNNGVTWSIEHKIWYSAVKQRKRSERPLPSQLQGHAPEVSYIAAKWRLHIHVSITSLTSACDDSCA